MVSRDEEIVDCYSTLALPLVASASRAQFADAAVVARVPISHLHRQDTRGATAVPHSDAHGAPRLRRAHRSVRRRRSVRGSRRKKALKVSALRLLRVGVDVHGWGWRRRRSRGSRVDFAHCG